MTNRFEYDTSNVPESYAESRRLPLETIDLWLTAISDTITKPITTILDLGCGEGRFSAALATKFRAEVYGVDPSEKMLALACERDRAIEHVTYIRGCGERIPLEDQSVSMVFLSMVYHHLDNVIQTVSEIERVLEPQGYVVVRNATKEDIEEHETFPFFASAKRIELQRMPNERCVLEAFGNGFTLLACSRLNQLFADNYREYYEKISKRGLSVLHFISDSDFEEGLKRLKDYCHTKPKECKAYERYHLFVFQKR